MKTLVLLLPQILNGYRREVLSIAFFCVATCIFFNFLLLLFVVVVFEIVSPCRSGPLAELSRLAPNSLPQ